MKKLSNTISFKLNRRIIFDVLKYTDKDIEHWLRNEFYRFKPDYIYGYAGTIYDMAKFIKEKGIKIHQIKKVITTSERLEQREFIEDVFKCKVIDQYGSTEVTEIAIEDENYVMHSADDFVIVEVNEQNEILLTPLESYGMPLLRYGLGDIGLSKKNGGHSQYPFGEFNLMVGRVYEILRARDGTKISGGLIKQMVEDENLPVREFQLIQKTIHEAELNIIEDEFTRAEGVKRLKEIVKEVLGCSTVNINYLARFPCESNGKRVAFRCKIVEQSEVLP